MSGSLVDLNNDNELWVKVSPTSSSNDNSSMINQNVRKNNKYQIKCFSLYFLMALGLTGCFQQKTDISQSATASEIITSVGGDNSMQKHEINQYTFEPLKNEETLKHEIQEDDTGRYLIIYAVGNNNERELLKFPIAYSRNYEDEIQYSTSGKRMVFQCMPNSKNFFELWFLNGEKIAKSLMRTISAFNFKIDDDCKMICVYDNHESQSVPILHIYDLYSMNELKRIQYEPYRNKGMYPVEMSYQNNAFSVILSADTVDFTAIEIPVEGPEQYRVVGSYSWEEENNRQNY